MAVNTLLWGGNFNPVIPAVAAVPDVWTGQVLITDGWTPQELIDEHLFAFDPDLLVVVPGAVLHDRDLSRWTVLEPNDVASRRRDSPQSQDGLTVYDAAGAYVSRELRRGDKVPVQVVQPKLAAEWRLLEAMAFGVEPEDFDATLDRDMQGLFVVERPEIAPDEYMAYLAPDMLSVRRLAHYGIDQRFREVQYYLLDVQDVAHVADFLLARAQGLNVLPIAIQSTASQRLIDAVRADSNPHGRATIWVAPGITNEDVLPHIQRLGFPHPWIHPRTFRAPIARGERAWAIVNPARRMSVPIEDGTVTVQLDEPWDGEFYEGFGGKLYASEVAVWWQDEKRLPPDVIPGGLETIWPRSKFYFLMHGRISSAGITFYNHLGGEETFPLPDATTIVREYFRTYGWTAEPSDEGLRASQSLSLMGGIYTGWWVVASEALDVLTSDHVSAAGEIGLYELRTALKKMGLDVQKIENLTRSLLNIDAIALGLRFKCTNCNRSPWYSIGDAADEVTCTFCRGSVKPEYHSMSVLTHAWTYRLQPPLDQPAYRSNLFGIFGAAGFFRSVRSDDITLALGLTVQKGDERSEIDLTLLVHERGEPARKKPTTVFVEAKGLAQKFDKADVASFERLLGDFPQATYIFSTLRDHLEEEEMAIIKAFREAGPAEHGVGILTRSEMRRLLDATDEDASYWRSVKYGVLSDLCEVTSRRYL